jgi:DNA processing protein
MFSSPPPLAPPTTEEDALRWLRLIRSPRVGIATFFRLLAEHGTAAAALCALPDIARASGVERYAPCSDAAAREELASGHRLGARLACLGAPEYPAALATIPDPPPVLWLKGDTRLAARPSIALVGARNASSLGRRMARTLATGLGEAGFAVVSGLARGIDTAAHEAAVEQGTIAVLAGGIDVAYPPENAALLAHLGECGLVVAEHAPGVEPQARHFPRRNRIVSGLAQAVVVVEAAMKSGSLITARTALEQGREVMAVPGHPLDARAAGCNALIRDGAVLVRSTGDVLLALEGAEPQRAPAEAAPAIAAAVPKRTVAPEQPALQPAQRRRIPPAPRQSALSQAVAPAQAAAGPAERILSLLGVAPVAEDQIIRDLGLPAQEVSAEILTLELAGQVERRSGGLLARCG